MSKLDVSQIGPRLYQGSYPPMGDVLKEHGFDVVVLAAREYQPEAIRFVGVRVIHAPMNDCPDVPVVQARRVAAEVARLWKRGARILVTCQAGLNRSGLITALAWRYITGRSGREAVRAVKRGRGDEALFNNYFRAYLEQLEPARSI